MLALTRLSSRSAASPASCSRPAPLRPSLGRCSRIRVNAAPTTEEAKKTEAEEATLKYGLEAGMFKLLTSKEGDSKVSRTDQAKELLAVYGSAYLITSISFALVSFGICYFAVSAGVDVSALLSKVGLQVNDTSETVGTFAIAYAAHKALSPIRFPPTVALTPVVAKWTGKKINKEQDQAQQ